MAEVHKLANTGHLMKDRLGGVEHYRLLSLLERMAWAAAEGMTDP